MRSMTQRERRLGLATAGVVVTAGFVWLVVDPQLTRQRVLAEEVARKSEILSNMRRNMLLKDRIERRYETLRSLIRRSGGQERELAAFTRLLSALHAGGGLQVGSLRVLPTINEAHYVRLVARMELKGPIAGVMDLLDDLARMPEPMRAERIELSCRQQAGVVDVSLEISQVVSPSAEGTPSAEGGGAEVDQAGAATRPRS